MLEFLIIFSVTFVATLFSSMAGGGSSIITLPVFLWLGMSYPLAISIQKISGVFWTLPVAYNYLHDRKIDFKFIFFVTFVGLFGTYFGVEFITSFDQEILQFVIGFVILFLVIVTFFRKDIGIHEKHLKSKLKEMLIYPVSFVLGFYEGIFGGGNGLFFSFAFARLRGLDFVDAIGNYFILAFVWLVFGSFMLISKGYFDIHYLIPSILGSVLGGYTGSRYAKYKGNKFMKYAFCCVGLVLGVKLILRF